MAQLPIVSGSEVNSPVAGGKIDAGAFRSAALAPGQVGAAIGDSVGGFFSDVSQKIQANRNARITFDADLSMRKAKDDFTANLAKMPDEGTWLPAWDEHVSNLREQVLDNPHAGPDVRRQLSMKFDSWQQATTAEIRTAALLKGAKETRDSGIADATYAASQGDIEGATNSVKAMVENHAMSPGEAKKFSRNLPSIAGQAQADILISNSPINAPEAIKRFQGVIDPKVFVAIQARARDAQGRAQSSNLDDFAQDMDASPDGTIDPEVLRKAVDRRDITQRGMNALMARMDRTKKADIAQKNRERIEGERTAKDQMNVLMLRADDISYLDNKDLAQQIRDLKEDGAELPAAMRRTLFEHIDAKNRSAVKTGESEESPVKRQILERMKEDREKNGLTIPSTAKTDTPNAFMKGVFGSKEKTTFSHFPGGLEALQKMDSKQFKEVFGADVKREDIIRAEQQHFADQNAKMRDWFKANPNAKEDEAETYRQSLERPYLMQAAAAELKKRAPTAISTKAEFDSLPSGAPFIFNGRVGTKN